MRDNVLELRRASRKQLRLKLTVFDSITEQALGVLGNLSSQGLMIIGSHVPAESAVLQIHIELPAAGKQPAQRIELGVQQQWHARTAGGQPRSGYRIIAASEAELLALNAWLNLQA